jgi:hypothetical protein
MFCRTIVAGLALALVACSGKPPPDAAATPPTGETAALPTGPARDAFLVNNQCSASGDTFVLHARIDADPIGGERPAATHVVWSITCKEKACRGTKVELDPWLSHGRLDAPNVGPLDGLELLEGAAAGFVVKRGDSLFRVDVSRSEVVFEESGRVRQHGTAPCSASGVAWPTGAH